MKAIILGAGYATRLYPLTENTPKPLLKVDGLTILDHIMLRLSFLDDVDEVCVITNDKFYPHFCEWQRKTAYQTLGINIVNDRTTSNDDRLGSIGDIHFALQETGWADAFLLINGDNLCTFSLAPAMNRFKEVGHTILTYDVGSIELATLYGVPFVDGDGRVTDFVEKPASPQSALVSIGVYLYGSNTPRLIAEYVESAPSVDKTGDFVGWLAAREKVYTHAVSQDDGLWFDIGTLDQLEEAEQTMSDLHTRPFASRSEVTTAIDRAVAELVSTAKPDDAPTSANRRSLLGAKSFLDVVRVLAGRDVKTRQDAVQVLDALAIPAATSWLLDCLADDRPSPAAERATVSTLAADALIRIDYAPDREAVYARATQAGFRCG